jgi:phage terminase large subunit-like protein
MTTRARRLSADWLSSLPESVRRTFLTKLTNDEIGTLSGSWRFQAREEQFYPPGSWRVWLFLGGRGAGKTRAGAEWLAEGIANRGLRRVAVLGATYHDARAVMIEGESGLMSVAGNATYEPSNYRILWPNGAVATVLSAEEPDGIRGHQFDAAWGDEFCKWDDPQAALDMLRMALRLGRKPQLAITTTPRNLPALKALVEAKGTTLTRGSTRNNIANLAPGFVEDLESRYAGTRLGRQELEAEIIADVEGALWKRDWIERGRVRAAPELDRVVVGVDPPASQNGCECGIVVAARGAEGEAYVLADRSQGGLTVKGWAARAAQAYRDFHADCIIAEVNQGGDMVLSALNDEMPDAPVRAVHASRGKKTRAGHASMIYENGRAHHVGVFPELEDQLCNFDGSGASPDRLDALVWAFADLFPGTKRAEPRVRTV